MANYVEYFVLFFETWFLCVALAILTDLGGHTEIHLPLPLECWD